MRYKEITLNNIEKLERALRAIESEINRGNRKDALAWLEKMKELLETTRSQVSVEQDDFNIRPF